MTFRVIEGGGPQATPTPGTVEEARAEIIDRVAAAIWGHQEGFPDPVYATWSEMKQLALTDRDRAANVRLTLRLARAAIAALRPTDAVDDADVEIVAAAWEGSTIGGPPSICLGNIQGWIDEVLK